jgi:preprotein translocase subunit SecE
LHGKKKAARWKVMPLEEVSQEQGQMPVAEKRIMAKAAAISTEAGEQGRAGNLITRSRDFLKDVRSEMRKVVTPSRAEVQSTTTVVVLSVFAFAAFFYVVDSIFGRALQALLHALGGTQ